MRGALRGMESRKNQGILDCQGLRGLWIHGLNIGRKFGMEISRGAGFLVTNYHEWPRIYSQIIWRRQSRREGAIIKQIKSCEEVKIFVTIVTFCRNLQNISGVYA